MNIELSNLFRAALTTRPAPIRIDPLALDLDGDGIEIVGINPNGPVLTFDHNADGLRTGTGWVRADDAWLVLDRNGNGSIDTGRELFGVDTLKASGQYATSGLDALRELDSNLDGLFNAQDSAFTQVQLWQDLNQDAISQADELSSLADKGIASINLSSTTANTNLANLGNGNTVGATAVVTRSDGSTTQAFDLNAAHNPFFRSFANDIAVSDAALALPDMGGAGWVRDLREAISLSQLQAAQLSTLPGLLQPVNPTRPLIDVVTAFAAAPTKAAQIALLDELIRAWAASNEYVPLKALDDPSRRFVVTGNPALSAQMQAIIPVLEIFNGLGVAQAGFQNPVLSNLALPDGSTQPVMTYTLFAEQVQPLLNAYEQLRQSVYGALVLQTRLKPYLDAVALVIEEGAIRFDTAGIDALLQQRAGEDALNAVVDLLDLRRHASQTLRSVGWAFEQTLADTLAVATLTPEITALLSADKLAWIGADTTQHTTTAAQAGFTVLGNARDNTLSGHAAGAERLCSGQGNDTLIAVGYGDLLDGGAGNDTLKASHNHTSGTTFIGGAGNDYLAGTYYNDIYLFNRGDGADTLNDYSAGYGYTDTLKFGEGIAASDIGARRSGNDLVLTVTGQEGDQITIQSWFGDSQGYFRIEQIGFTDGVNWSSNDLAQLALRTSNTGTTGNDTLSGTDSYSERLVGGEGNDTLTAVGYWDVLDGGAGNDTLKVNHSHTSGTTFIGGAGNDYLAGTYYNDTYHFNRGDGADTLNDYSAGYVYTDTLKFGEGIAASDIGARRAGNDLVLTVAGQEGDQITIQSWFGDSQGYFRIEQISFADGISWTTNDLAQLALRTTNTGTDGNDTLSGTDSYSDRLVGGEGNDTLTAVGYWDVLDGGAGNDTLRVNHNHTSGTTFIGGQGNDTLAGTYYNDTYVFNRGDGADTLVDYCAGYVYTDTLKFGTGISVSDIGARRSGNDLVLTVAGADGQSSGDQITIQSWFGDSQGLYRIEQISFADGTSWTGNDLAQLALRTTNTGTTGNDTISGTDAYSERLVGGEGSDTLTAVGYWDVLDGGAGNDTLKVNHNHTSGTTFIGGQGSDYLAGTYYNDTYLFNRGDGADVLNDYSAGYVYTDTLKFGPGIASSDIGARRSGNDLVLTVAGQEGDQITIQSWFGDSQGYFRIEQIAFADGTNWGSNDLAQFALRTTNTGGAGNDTLAGTEHYSDRLVGAEGNDTLTAVGYWDVLDGGAGNDTLRVNHNHTSGTTFIGGSGNDTLTGTYYNDTYVFNRGDGADTLNDYSAGYVYTDTLRFGEGIAASDIGARRSGNDLVLTVAGLNRPGSSRHLRASN